MDHQILWEESSIKFGGIVAPMASYIPLLICKYFKILIVVRANFSELLLFFVSVHRPATVLPGSGQQDDSGNA